MYLLVIYIILFSSISSYFLGFLLGSFLIYLNTFILFLALLITTFIFYEVVLNHFVCYVKIGNWFFSLNINFNFELMFDELSVIMLYVVLLISFFVHFFSISYMRYDPNYYKFFSYLSLFTFFMMILVLSTNFIQLFLGWEGIGICSYLLINFWSTRLEANRSAIKALVLNKLGDCAFYIFIINYYFLFDTFDFILPISFFINYMNFNVVYFDLYFYDFLTLFLIIAAIAKSAQIGLHVWLPDAMEGPTPVSSLLHAATMVTAGVYLLLRVSWIIDLSNLSSLIVIIAILTNFFTSLIAVFQYDVKKIIAYSTASQLALMFMAIGLSSFNLAFYHLFNHAFFKALLFLCAGSIIHFLNNKQDIRATSFLYYFMPFTYISFLIGQLTLIGFPFLSSYYSKDMILQFSFFGNSYISYLLLWFLNISVILTAFYSLRLIKFLFFTNSIKNIFFNKLYTIEQYDLFIFLPLFFLSFFSLFIGYIVSDIFSYKLFYFFKDIFFFNFNTSNYSFISFLEYSNFFIFFLTLIGCWLGYFFDYFLQKYKFFFFFIYL